MVPTNDLVWVEWLDAQSASERTHDVATVKLATNINIGWIAHENERRIVLAHGVCSSEETDFFAIPRGNIISMTRVTPEIPS